jgi:hypothetical protein
MFFQNLILYFKKCVMCHKRLSGSYAEVAYRYTDPETNISGTTSTVKICENCAGLFERVKDAKEKADSVGNLGEDDWE